MTGPGEVVIDVTPDNTADNSPRKPGWNPKRLSVEQLRPKHYRRKSNGQIVRTFPKLRGKSAVKKAKRSRRKQRRW